MKLKLKLRVPLLCLLFLMVVSTLFFYTDTLTTFSSSSWSSSSPSAKDQFIEEISKLWQENSAALKEPVVNSDNSSSEEKDVHNSRQLQQDLESVEHKSRVLSDAKSHSDQSDVRNPMFKLAKIFYNMVTTYGETLNFPMSIVGV